MANYTYLGDFGGSEALPEDFYTSDTSGRTANDDGSKTGGSGKVWEGIKNAGEAIRSWFGDTNYYQVQNTQSKMSAGVWIAIVGVILVVVVLAVVLVNRNK